MEPDQKPESGQPPWVQVQPPPQPAPPAPRRGCGCGLSLGGLIALLLGASLLLNFALLWGGGPSDAQGRIQERHFSHNRRARNKVAIISLEGPILDGRGFVKRQIDRARKDPQVKAVVFRVNSPGGTVTGADFLYHHLRELGRQRDIPIVVSMGPLAASGGYYVAMAAGPGPDRIFAEPTTWTGSIGVIIPHFDAEELLKKLGIRHDSILSHPLKGMGSLTRAMTEQEREIFGTLVAESFTRFKQVVQSGRARFHQDPAALDKLATGQVFSAQQALSNGLIDRIGFLEDAVDRAIELAGLPADQVHVIEYRREPSLLELLVGVQAKDPAVELAALLELTVPRAYYLCSWMPPLVSTDGAGKP